MNRFSSKFLQFSCVSKYPAKFYVSHLIIENAAGRCHIFHQLVDICKEMGETIVLMDKSLSSTVSKYKKEKSLVTEKATSSFDYLKEASRKVELNETIMSTVDQTLQVVNQGMQKAV